MWRHSAPWAPGDRRQDVRELSLLRGLLLVLWFSLWFGLWVSDQLPIASWDLLLSFGAWILLGLLTEFRLRQTEPVDDDELFLQLLSDVLILTAIFLHTGGHTNPLVTYYLVPLAISAASLSWRHSVFLAALMMLAVTGMTLFPRPSDTGWPWSSDVGHLLGMWFTFVLSALLMLFFVSRLQLRLKRQQALWAHQERQYMQSRQAVAVGTLAATTVHEMATPLGSLTLLLDELAEVLPEPGSPSPDATWPAVLATCRAQVSRCQTLLETLRARARANDTPSVLSLSEALHTAGQALSLRWPQKQLVWQAPTVPDAALPCPEWLRQVIDIVLTNACEAATARIHIAYRCHNAQLELRVQDDGPGWPASASAGSYLGQSSKPHGFGWGLFLAETVLREHAGMLEQLTPAHGGALLVLRCPESALTRSEQP